MPAEFPWANSAPRIKTNFFIAVKFSKRLMLSAALAAAGAAFASAPDWWAERGISGAGYDHLSDEARKDAMSVLNAGQLKNIAKKAREELDEKLSSIGGAGVQVSGIVDAFKPYAESDNPDENFEAVNMGQVKFVAKAFFDRLYEAQQSHLYDVNFNGIVLLDGTKYPWTPKPSAEGPELEAWRREQFCAAAVGQLKYVFSWSIGKPAFADSNGNGIDDNWEMNHYGRLLESGELDGNPDLDGDGIKDVYEYKLGAVGHSSEGGNSSASYDQGVTYDGNSMIIKIGDKTLERDAEGNVTTLKTSK